MHWLKIDVVDFGVCAFVCLCTFHLRVNVQPGGYVVNQDFIGIIMNIGVGRDFEGHLVQPPRFARDSCDSQKRRPETILLTWLHTISLKRILILAFVTHQRHTNSAIVEDRYTKVSLL